jgi:hypothetical protein
MYETGNRRQPVRGQFGEILAGRPFGDQEQLLNLAVADAPTTLAQIVEQLDLARTERYLPGCASSLAHDQVSYRKGAKNAKLVGLFVLLASWGKIGQQQPSGRL